MHTRFTVLTAFAFATLGLAAPSAHSDAQVPRHVYTVTAAEAATMGYVGRRPAETSGVVFFARSERVGFRDLDLSDPADAARLQQRIDAAARRACKDIGRRRAVSTPGSEECARAASERALARLRQAQDGTG